MGHVRGSSGGRLNGRIGHDGIDGTGFVGVLRHVEKSKIVLSVVAEGIKITDGRFFEIIFEGQQEKTEPGTEIVLEFVSFKLKDF